MNLGDLLRGMQSLSIHGSPEVPITSLSWHSQQAFPGSFFLPSKPVEPAAIAEALRAGVAAVLTPHCLPLDNVVQVVGSISREERALLAARFYGFPSRQLFTVGVTGTSGKTTTTFLLKHLLDSLKQPCGLIGGVEYVVGQQHYPASLTTPDALVCQQLLRQMVQQECRAMAMEVSSHALDQSRVACIDFDVAIFTNLTHEHLDYHKTMEGYATAKASLFSNLHRDSIAIINKDSPWSPFIVKDCPASIWTYGLDSSAMVWADRAYLTAYGMRFDVHAFGQKERFYSRLVGKFNLYNLLGAIALGLYLRVSLRELAEIFAHVPCVPGRLEQVWSSPSVFVDYAHKDDALRNVLETLQEVTPGRIFTVFGCGGNRDLEKRPRMAEVAERYSDYVIVTNDNPRNESPEQIVSQILLGFSSKEFFEVIFDRKEAIFKALGLAQPQDAVLIAGKGHETGQVVGQCVHPFDDRLIVRDFYEHFDPACLACGSSNRVRPI